MSRLVAALKHVLFLWLQPFNIIREGDESVVYLRRYHVFKNRWIQIYFHNIRLPDEDDSPHDHPWSFLTLIVRGGYTDEQWIPHGNQLWDEPYMMKNNYNDVLRLGSIRFRPAEHIHRVRDVQPDTWTLVFGGPVVRMWGFWKRDGAKWVPWRQYLGIPEGTEYKGD